MQTTNVPMRSGSNLSLTARVLMVLTMLLALSACSSGPPPTLYLLEPVHAKTDAAELAKKSGIEALGMSPVILPGYATSSKITGLRADGTVIQDDANQWAEEPEDAITRLLAERLRAHTESTVLVEPWPRDFEPSARVEVTFGKFLREPRGGAYMSGQILLLSADGRQLLKAMPFNLRHIGFDVDNRVFFRAVAKGVDDIARQAVEEIQALQNPA